jgi:creatinine amidohydrolase
MQWEQLTGDEFEAAVAQAEGVCVIAVGVIEYHGPQLPLGVDMLRAHAVACEAARREPAIVYPAYHFGVNVETKHFPGGIVLRDRLMFDLLENVCDEISRNGLKKIILLSGHGGNCYFLPLFVQLCLDKGKDYTLYCLGSITDLPEVYRRVMETKAPDHAGEWETSVSLHTHPELVRMEALGPEPWPAAEAHLDGIRGELYTAVDWYGQYPAHREGTPQLATAEKGEVVFEAMVAKMVEILKIVKADEMVPDLYATFNERIYRR